jgi:signal transduction histidine kinase/ligand-binding sensor domain-containing protein
MAPYQVSLSYFWFMPFIFKFRYLAILWLLSGPVNTIGQDFRKAFLHISSDDGLGLLSNNIASLYQDKTGFIWVGTSNGIQRFDGAKFVTYSTEKPGSEKLPEEQVRQMAGNGNNKIWLLFEHTGKVGIFDPVKVTYHNIPIKITGKLPPRTELNLWTDSKSNAYINLYRYGKILKYDSIKNEFNENTPLNNLPRGWKGGGNVFEDTLLKRYWIITDSGLCIYDEPSGQTWSRHFNPKKISLLEKWDKSYLISEFYIDKKRRHWYFYWTGGQNFNCYSEQGEALKDTAGLMGVNTGYAEPRKFLETNDGALYLYGPGCLYTLDGNSSKFTLYRSQYTDNYNIRYENVNAVLEDRDGMVWVATDQGLYYHSPRRDQLANVFLSPVPGYYEVTDLLQLKDGNYWVSTWGRGILAMDKDFRYYYANIYNENNKDYVRSRTEFNQTWTLLQHSSGKIFIGCQAGRLMIYDPATGTTQFLEPPAFEKRTIRYIAEDKNGHLWFGTQAGAVIRYNGTDFKLVYRLEETAIIYKIFIDKADGNIWLATHERGLYAINPNNFKIVQHFTKNNTANPLFGDKVSDLEQLNDSLMYAAASGVLHVINKKTGKVKILSTAEGLPSNSVMRIRLDAKGYLWIITHQGLCHFDWRKNRFTSFGKKDGIFLGDLVSQCDILDKNNNVLFAGPNSLLSFNPDAFYNNPRPNRVTITDFKLLNSFLPVDSLLSLPAVRLQPGENSFGIYFSSLSYRNRGQFTYYYQLEGADKDWVKADGSQSAQYRLLPAGRYTFRVKVENLDGVSADVITTMKIIVKPQFWQTGWFISLLVMIFAMIGYGMHRLRLTRLLAVEKIRARVSRDLHDDMGSTLSTINILSSMAKAKMASDPKKTAEYIGKIGDNSQRMMEAMDDIVWAIKPDNDTMQRLIARMREFATNVLEAKDMQIEFLADEELNNLKPDMEYRRDLFLLFKEAVNNAAKYSQGTKVTIQITAEFQKLKMEVADNGKGFDTKQADTGNGLGNMHRRAAALRGNLRIFSEPGKGTSITLISPLSN